MRLTLILLTLSLALANVSVENDNMFVSQWTETDFRTGDKPWWA